MEIREQYHFRIWCPLLLALLAIGCSNRIHKTKLYNLNEVVVVERGGVTYVNQKPINGKLYQLNAAADTVFLASYNNGKKNGLYMIWNNNHELIERRMFVNGLKNGVHEGWWDNGQRKFIYNYKNDELDGNAKEWNPVGLLVKDFNYSNGYESGPQKLWYKNGKIKANYEVINGRRYGLFGEKACINQQDKTTL